MTIEAKGLLRHVTKRGFGRWKGDHGEVLPIGALIPEDLDDSPKIQDEFDHMPILAVAEVADYRSGHDIPARMDAARRVGALWDRAAKGKAAVDAVPFNEDYWNDDFELLLDDAAATDTKEWDRLQGLYDSFKWYGFTGYQPINAALRAGLGDMEQAKLDDLVPELQDPEMMADAKANTSDILELMEQSRLKEDVVVWRGVGSIQAMLGRDDVDDDNFPDIVRGMEWIDHGFSSTAAEVETTMEFLEEAHLPTLAAYQGEAEPMPVMIRILVPKGTRALSRDERDGTEILLPPGMRYKVWSTYRLQGRKGGTPAENPWVMEVIAMDGWDDRRTEYVDHRR